MGNFSQYTQIQFNSHYLCESNRLDVYLKLSQIHCLDFWNPILLTE